MRGSVDYVNKVVAMTVAPVVFVVVISGSNHVLVPANGVLRCDIINVVVNFIATC